MLDRLRGRIPALGDAKYRFTAGCEPIPSEGSHIRPRVFGFPIGHEYHSAVFAFCGRATLAFEAVRQTLELLKDLLPPTATKRRTRHSRFQIGTPWRDPVRSHFYDYYEDFDDHKGRKETLH